MSGVLLALDTATRRASVAVGDGEAAPMAQRTWLAGYRHGEELLAALDGVLHEAHVGLADVAGVVVGTGPGAFTGLRVGLATAKGLAYGLGVPIVGVATAEALASGALAGDGARADWAAGDGLPVVEVAVILPAGPHDRYFARYRRDGRGWLAPVGDPALLPGAEPLAHHVVGAWLVAVDLAVGPEIPEAAVARGQRAQEGLGAALLELGAAGFRDGAAVDVAELVPVYVTLPRGIVEQAGAIEWSRDPR